MSGIEVLEEDMERLSAAAQKYPQPLGTKCRAQREETSLQVHHADPPAAKSGKTLLEGSLDRLVEPIVHRRRDREARRSTHAGSRLSRSANHRSISDTAVKKKSARLGCLIGVST
jgi:hypothetical protein